MELPKPKEQPVETAKAAAARCRRQLNDVKTALDSPRCVVIWEMEDNGDSVAHWIMEACESEMTVNVSDLQRTLKELAAKYGPDMEKSRQGKLVTVDLPMLKEGVKP
jgi:hypothetical protein